MTNPCFAKRFEFSLDRWSLLLDKVCEHRPWFDDVAWADPSKKRAVAASYLGDGILHGILWEVWRGDELTGIILLNQLTLGRDGTAHFVFFDHKLADKRALCLSGLAWGFDKLDLQVIRTEVPTYARALAHWARHKLGFKWEAEGRQLTWPDDARPLTAREAELGSRRYRTMKYNGEWVDTLLLSLTREEFTTNGRTHNDSSERQHGSVAVADTRRRADAAGVPQEP